MNPTSCRILIRRDSYHDSVFLMRITQEVKRLAGIEDAAVVMGTPANKALLAASGLAGVELESARPNDLVIAVRAQEVDLAEIEGTIARVMAAEAKEAAPGEASRPRSRTLAAALKEIPEANLVLISVPGVYAAREARRALARGLHVMLFSDNVALEDEVSLKEEAARRGLLLMGPDCGTAILNGKPLAFANVVRRGPIGVVGASGTGIQEITSCVHRLGGGITQAIGTGGRDLSAAVGGRMTLQAIEALGHDTDTRVIVVVSKPPSREVATKVIAALGDIGKPGVVHFVGASPSSFPSPTGRGIVFADSLAGAAEEACRLAGIPVPVDSVAPPAPAWVENVAARLRPNARLRGLFCGGTTGHEALSLLVRDGIEVRSNLHHDGPLQIKGAERARGHVVLDLGADEFTVGRPHPMIEPVLRNERLALEMEDDEVGILLFDVILGDGSHPDPAGVLVEGLERTREIVAARGRRPDELVAVASITGTPEDPQGYDRQRRTLEDAGVIVRPDNRQAVRLAASLLLKLGSSIQQNGKQGGRAEIRLTQAQSDEVGS